MCSFVIERRGPIIPSGRTFNVNPIGYLLLRRGLRQSSGCPGGQNGLQWPSRRLCGRQDSGVCRRAPNPSTDLEEQVIALKFIPHFVGDLHQPLHS